MPITKRIAFWIFVLAGICGTIFAERAPGAKNFVNSNLAKILFYHLPNAMMTLVLCTLAALWGFVYLRSRSTLADARLGVALRLGMFCAAYTMASGILFSRAQWGDWWSNDPRQTSFLMVLLILAAGVTLRGSISDQEKRRATSAAYSLFSYLPILFLVVVYPRLPQVAQVSLHPTNTIAKGSLDGTYWTGVMFVIIALAALAVLLTQIACDQVRKEELDGLDDDGAAGGPMVRPRPLA